MRKNTYIFFLYLLLLLISCFFSSPDKIFAEEVTASPSYAVSNGSGNSWEWGENASASDNYYASVGLGRGVVSQDLMVGNFGFNIPSNATIDGIKVEVERHASNSYIKDFSVKVLKSWTVSGDDRADTSTGWPTSDTDSYVTYGVGTTDKWGLSLTPEDINSSNFGFSISVKNYYNKNSNYTGYIDHIRITVYYTPSITLGQSSYRWYVNNSSSNDVTDPWPSGLVDINENTAIGSSDSPPSVNDILRLRMSILDTYVSLPANNMSFKLKYAEMKGGACSGTDETWLDIGNTGSTSAAWRAYDNTSVANNSTLSQTRLSNSDVTETYTENNTTANNPNSIPINQEGEWDWVVQNYSASEGVNYCFKTVKSDGTDLNAYNNYPRLITYKTPPVSEINQRSTILQNDSIGITLPSSYIAKIGEKIKVRIQIETGSGASTHKVFKLQYDKNDNNWTDVRVGGEIRPAESSYWYDISNLAGPVSGSCTAGKTWYPGKHFSNRFKTDSFLINSNACSEISFVIDTRKASLATAYRFRLLNYSDNSPLSNYYAYPIFTTVSSANDNQRYSKSLNPSLKTDILNYKNYLDNFGYDNLSTNDASYEILNNLLSDTFPDLHFDNPDNGNTSFAYVASSAGDVNNDGYEDLIVGAPASARKCSGCGAAYIFFGGAVVDNNYDVYLIYPNSDAASFGFTVSGGFDYDGDGFDDVVVGTEREGGGAYIFYGGVNMDGNVDLTLVDPIQDWGYFGYSVASGDFNHDGYGDVLVGKSDSDIKCDTCGAAYLYLGGPTPNDVNDLYIEYPGTDISAFFGSYVSSAGDFNNDGYEDMIIASPYSDYKCVNCGAAFVFYGGTTMVGTSSVYLEYPGTDVVSWYGRSISSAADFNGDNIDDIVVGAKGSDLKCVNCGAAFVFYGGTSPNGTSDLRLDYPETDADNYFGHTLTSSGDVDNDGYFDILVGAYSSDTKCTDCGSAYVFYGGTNPDGVSDLVYPYSESDTGSNFGNHVVSEDLNGDSLKDIIIGASFSDIDGASNGSIFVYYTGIGFTNTNPLPFTYLDSGSNPSFGYTYNIGDINDDKADDLLVGCNFCDTAYVYFGGNGYSNFPDLTFSYPETGPANFSSSAAPVGDVNGDGFGDFVIGATGSDKKCLNCGAVFLYYGGPNINNTYDVYLEYPNSDATSNFGGNLSPAGDVNRDGFDDVLVGAYSSDTKCTNCGAAYIYYGGSEMDGTYDLYFAYPGADTTANFGAGTRLIGDYNGDSYEDIAIGAYYANTSVSEGSVFIYYGGPSFDTTYDLKIDYPELDTGSVFGQTISAGDVNGDLFPDLIVGSKYSDLVCSYCGAVYVYFGSTSPGTTPDLTFSSPEVSANQPLFGSLVESTDIDKDGFDDIIVGSAAYNLKCSSCGAAFAYYGGPAIDNTYDEYFEYPGSDTAAGFGSYLATGNFNPDKYSDIVIGSINSDIKCLNCGYVEMHLGGRKPKIPFFLFADKSSSSCSSLYQISANWNGFSSVGGASKSLTLEAFRFGTTNAWETVVTNSSFLSGTDVDIGTTKTSDLSEYCDANNWSYWRLSQASGNILLGGDSWSINFTATAGEPPNPPQNPFVNNITAQTGQSSPVTGLYDHTPAFSAVFDDPDTNDKAQNYQIQFDTDIGFSAPVFWDTGKTSLPDCNENSRCNDIIYNGSTLSDGSTYYWRIKYWDDSDTEGSWSDVAQFTMNNHPLVSNVIINGGNPISLWAGTTKPVEITAQISDADGYGQINLIQGKFYRSGVGETCTNDNNSCYEVTNCSTSNCSVDTCDANCSVDVYFHSDSTSDDGFFPSQYWRAWIQVGDTNTDIGSTFSSSTTSDIQTLLGVDVGSSISFGELFAGENTGSTNVEVTITNVGNILIDLEISGDYMCVDYPTCSGYKLSPTLEKFSTSQFNYLGGGTTLPLFPSYAHLDIGLSKPTTAPSQSFVNLYWGINIPQDSELGLFVGENYVTAASGN